MELTTLELILLSILGVIIWKFIRAYVRNYRVLKQYYDAESEHLDQLAQRIHVVRQEEHEDVYYWYEQDTNEFLVQGATDEEIIQSLKSRFPDDVFIIGGQYLLMGPDFHMVKFSEDETSNA